MLKTIALVGIFAFTSAVSTVAISSPSQKTVRTTQSAPTAPRPQGFCFPVGTKC
jgi:hypothetical protein